MKLSKEEEKIIKEWKKKVFKNPEVRNLGKDYYWDAMFFGFALAKGIKPKKANLLALYARYELGIA